MKARETQWRILQVLASLQDSPSVRGISDSELAQSLELDIQQVRDHLDLMEEEGYVRLARTFSGCGAWLTARGRIVVQDPSFEQQDTSAPVVNILNVIDSQIQNLALAGNEAIITQSVDSDTIDQVFKRIDEIVAVVRSIEGIESTVKRDYELEAEGLKIELKKSRLNLSRIRNMLSALGDVDGTLGLATRLAPYFLAIGPYLEKLLQH